LSYHGSFLVLLRVILLRFFHYYGVLVATHTAEGVQLRMRN